MALTDTQYYLQNYVYDGLTYRPWRQYSDTVYRAIDVGSSVGLPPSNGLIAANPYSEVELSSTVIIFSESNSGLPPADKNRIILLGNFSFAADGRIFGTVTKAVRVLGDGSYSGKVFSTPVVLDEFLTSTSFSAAINRYAGTSLSSTQGPIPQEFATYLPAGWQNDPFVPDLVSVDATPPQISSASVSGNQITIQFTEAISSSVLPAASNFIITVSNVQVSITSRPQVSPTDPTKLIFNISVSPTSNQAVLITYNDPTPGANNTSGVVEDLFGNDLGSITGVVVETYISSVNVTALASEYKNLLLTGTAVTATGNSGLNAITGNSVANIINGNAGLDKMDGLGGSDIYLINSGSDHTDGEINDTGALTDVDEIRFAATNTTNGSTLVVFSTDKGLERAVIGTGTGATATTAGTTSLNIDATNAPNGLTIIGNTGINTLTGTAYADSLIGNAGNDIINGLAGNDFLNGGAGTDKMNGGEGADIYFVATNTEHSAAEVADTGSSGGLDELRFASTTAGQTLSIYAGDTGLERITIGTGTDAITNTSGTVGLNINASQAVYGLTIIGNNGINTITGTAYNDIINGNEGNDIIIGGNGNDTLTGGSGQDTFRFATQLNSASNVDTITDFTPTTVSTTTDRIQLENTGTGLFTGLTRTGTLSPAAFINTNSSSFTTSSQRILYNNLTGDLFYDPDGNGAGSSILFAKLSSGLAMTASQFNVT